VVEVVHGLRYMQAVAIRSAAHERSDFALVRKWKQDIHRLDAPNHPGYQFLQSRGIVVIKTPLLGHVAVLPMGMTQVSSAVLTVKGDDALKRDWLFSVWWFGCGSRL